MSPASICSTRTRPNSPSSAGRACSMWLRPSHERRLSGRFRGCRNRSAAISQIAQGPVMADLASGRAWPGDRVAADHRPAAKPRQRRSAGREPDVRTDDPFIRRHPGPRSRRGLGPDDHRPGPGGRRLLAVHARANRTPGPRHDGMDTSALRLGAGRSTRHQHRYQYRCDVRARDRGRRADTDA